MLYAKQIALLKASLKEVESLNCRDYGENQLIPLLKMQELIRAAYDVVINPAQSRTKRIWAFQHFGEAYNDICRYHFDRQELYQLISARSFFIKQALSIINQTGLISGNIKRNLRVHFENLFNNYYELIRSRRPFFMNNCLEDCLDSLHLFDNVSDKLSFVSKYKEPILKKIEYLKSEIYLQHM
jgi:hypothetical protein